MRTHSRTARIARRGLIAAVLALSTTAAIPASATGPGQPAATAPATTAPAGTAPLPTDARPACNLPSTGHAACLSFVTGAAVHAPHSASPAQVAEPHAYAAADLQDAYKLPSTLLGARQTVAIVIAFDNPNAEKDLAVYRKANGLPACDDDFRCFRKVDQHGGTSFPAPDGGWALESSLDLDMASAVCPNCQLLLVEADDNSMDNLAAAVDTAVRLGADVVSNSYGTAGEFPEELGLAAHFDHPGAVIVAASGDAGFGVGAPAVYGSVVAVGGTSLYQQDGPRGWAETVWPGAGSGCSAYVEKPTWQRDDLCDKRTVADVAAVADPATPVAVYDTFGLPGWIGVGGTSAATPIIAGVYALAGNAAGIDADRYLYEHAHTSAALYDVTTGFQGGPGSNGFCGGSYLCTTVGGYDGPTGLGTPHGIGAF
jgi:subtilase family serine protease